MNATEIMTREVVSIASDTPIRNIAKLMVDQRVSGVPVIDNGKLVGIISENDLVRRVELGTEKTRSRWVQFLTSNDTLLAEYVHARGRVARDVMTTNVVTVAPDDSIAVIAEILETRHIKRVPVVDDGKVVGIVSRANLLQALVAVGSAKVAPAPTDDAVIHDAIVAEIEKIA
jgi:CBS domain-containing protein